MVGKLKWDVAGERRFENGVDHGVLYPRDATGVYPKGVVWNGLTTVTESPSGAEAQPQYADNRKYITLRSAEEFGATVEAFTYPPEFELLDGTASPAPGVSIGQQDRGVFGLSYRSNVGNDLNAQAGYKLHLLWGATASPSEKAFTTINDSPEPIGFSWELTTDPTEVPGFKPTAIITIDSTRANPANLLALETLLYGDTATEAKLPSPEAVLALFPKGAAA